ncbi:MAG: glucose-1-phosphate adenylyltransferase [Oscillospiraceae bacterium]|nr:glucose-1-phosphate adenylyltransferase [Oscillospiraceae bacterium]
MKKETVAMLLAGGQGSRLYVLTSRVAKPAVPFGGKYRIIDFPLSNCANSGIDTVGVLTQYRPLELNSYIGNGQPWDLDRAEGGVHILPPYVEKGDEGTWYKGTANAIYQNIGFIDSYDPDYVLVLSGDHVYKMDYSDMIERHKRSGADCTISVMEVPWDEAPRFGIMNVDENDTITEFEEKPEKPKSNLASMGIYVFSWKELRRYLIDDENDENSQNDFGKNIIPNMLKGGRKLAAFRFSGYWKDVGTIESLWDANMDMLAGSGGLSMFDPAWPIYARSPERPPAYLSEAAYVRHSVVTQGSSVEGMIENSVVSHSVTVAKGAVVRYSILMPGVVIDEGAEVEYSIIAEGVHIGRGAKVGLPPEKAGDPDKWGVAVLGSRCCIADGEIVGANTMLDGNHGKVARK